MIIKVIPSDFTHKFYGNFSLVFHRQPVLLEALRSFFKVLSMSWFYSMDGQQAGPVEQDVIFQMLQQQQITPQTLVWQEGMPEWKPVAEIELFAQAVHAAASAPPPPAPGTIPPPAPTPNGQGMVTCPTCSTNVLPDFLIPSGNTHICPNCKDDYLQRMREGAPAEVGLWSGGTGGKTPNRELTAQARAILGDNNWGTAILFSFLLWLVKMGIQMIPFGIFALVLCMGAFLVGSAIFYIKLSRDEKVDYGMMFQGFQVFGKSVGAILIIGLVSLILSALCVAPAALFFFTQTMGDFDHFEDASLIITSFILAYIPLIIAMTYIWIRFGLVFYVIADEPERPLFDTFRHTSVLLNGKKWKYFFFHCRFIGWHILAGLTLGLGYLILTPYLSTSTACFYNDIQEPVHEPA